MKRNSKKKEAYSQELANIAERLDDGRADRTQLNWRAEVERETAQFVLNLFRESPTTYVRNSKRFLNQCGWYNLAQITRMGNQLKQNKQAIWRILQKGDYHIIMVNKVPYYRYKSTMFYGKN